jgi:hypothetical protein
MGIREGQKGERVRDQSSETFKSRAHDQLGREALRLW